MRNIRQNLFLAFVYNALAIPVAAGVLYPLTGLLLHPMLAAAAMSFGSVSVIMNAAFVEHTALANFSIFTYIEHNSLFDEIVALRVELNSGKRSIDCK